MLLFVVAQFAPALVHRFGQSVVLAVGTAGPAAAYLWLAVAVSGGADLIAVLAPTLLLGASSGLAFMPATSLVLRGVAPSDSGSASGLNQTAQQLGGSIGLAVIVSVFSSFAADGGFAAGVGPGFFAATGLSVLALVLVATVIRRTRLRPTTPTAPLRADALTGREEEHMTAGTTEAIDRLDVTAVAHRLARAMDDRDWTLLETCFTEDATGDFATGPAQGIPAVRREYEAFLTPLEATQHLLANTEVLLDGDTAIATSAFQAQHVRMVDGAPAHFLIGGRYTDDLVRTDAGWRIAHRAVRPAWTDGDRRVIGATLQNRNGTEMPA